MHSPRTEKLTRHRSTQEVDDLRAQKAADDREREVKLHALKHPAFS